MTNKLKVIQTLMDTRINIESRTVIMSTFDDHEINNKTVDHIMMSLDSLEHLNSKPIKIMMNNPGGDYHHGMAIFDRIKDSPCEITIIAYGYCMSMGSIIIQAADHRLLTPHAIVMIHSGSEEFEGSPEELAAYAEISSKIEQTVIDIYNEKCSIDKIQLKEFYRASKYFTAKEAVKYGLADGIFTRPKRKHTLK